MISIRTEFLAGTGKRSQLKDMIGRARQKRFILEYLKDHNGTQAAIRAGYSPRTAKTAASRLLRNVKVTGEIQRAMEPRAQRVEIKADMVLQEIAKRAFASVWDYIHIQPDGSVTPDFTCMEKAQADGIAKLTVDEYTHGRGKDARLVRTTRLGLDKLRALELLGKHLGLFTRRHKHEVGLNSGGHAELPRLLGLEGLTDAEFRAVIDHDLGNISRGIPGRDR